MDGDGVVELVLGHAQLQRHGEALQDFVRALAEQVDADHAFLRADGLSIHLTASVGIASMPDVAASEEALIQAADQAMYRVKQRGKNGIFVATAAVAD